MTKYLVSVVLAGAVSLATSPAFAAGEKKASPTKKADATGEAKEANAVQGKGPFWESVTAGVALFLSRDFDGAIAKYREALTHSPKNPLGHYRLGEALRDKGELADAAASFDTALRFSAPNARLRAQVLFVQADVAERQKNLSAAEQKWTEYIAFANANSKVRTYKASAEERKKRVLEAKQREADAAPVRERIKQREAEAASGGKKK
jgi:tetratricopeptide (TPR) repeat protein